ncbi:MAG: hypothetical protein ACI976_001564 [Aureispira sp.]|jgi:hypothetical protein
MNKNQSAGIKKEVVLETIQKEYKEFVHQIIG